MNLLSVFDSEFLQYGSVLQGYDFSELISELNKIECFPGKVTYCADDDRLNYLPVSKMLSSNFYGGKPIQVGYCCGQNQALNCLEYHRSDEVNVCATDVILFLAKQEELVDYQLDTACVKAFLAPAGTAYVLRSSTLHYAPCQTEKTPYFMISVVLPKGTNMQKPDILRINKEDDLLWGTDKWLIAHKDAPEVQEGAFVGLLGDNLQL